MYASRSKGLTVVELLIVLSIVLVLVLIAVPEYLEARVVSDVARTHSDLRRIQTALDSYFLDFCVYPTNHDPFNSGDGGQNGFKSLTTPFPYLDAIPQDPFANWTWGRGDYEGGSDGAGCAGARIGMLRDLRGSYRGCIHAYLIMGVGPDQNDNVSGNDWFPGRKPSREVIILSYSPTNGLESRGDIVRMTGSYKEGLVILDGVTLGD